jgi:hypothetical protein
MTCNGYATATSHVPGHRHNKTASTRDAQGPNDSADRSNYMKRRNALPREAYSHQKIIYAEVYGCAAPQIEELHTNPILPIQTNTAPQASTLHIKCLPSNRAPESTPKLHYSSHQKCPAAPLTTTMERHDNDMKPESREKSRIPTGSLTS